MHNIKVTRSGYVVEIHRVCVQLSNGKEVTGIVNIAENNCKRLSELFTKDSNGYIIMCKCDNGQKVMFINKAHILWATPMPI